MTDVSFSLAWFYLVPLLMTWGLYIGYGKLKSLRSLAVQQEEFEAGLTEPATLHPAIDPVLCMGCGSCVKACPEQNTHPVLGLINGKSQLVAPSNCIGHGACKTACPFDAITLVFGTAQRGIDIPLLSPNFETNMPGIFIAGELGGMGLIRNAVEQGYKAMDAINDALSTRHDQPIDVVVIGAGPAGFSASLRAKQLQRKCVTLEQDSLGGTVFQFPRGKLVMTAPVDIPLVGRVKFTETTKEELLDFWRNIEHEQALTINYQERVDAIEPSVNGYKITTSKSTYETRTVLLSIGRRGTPRKLAVPGEDLTKVVYRLLDPEQYRGLHVLVVGGGDSALEAALSIAAQPGSKVTLSHRGGAFSRAKKRNRERIDAANKSGKVTLLLNSNVRSFTEDTVTLDQDGTPVELPNNAAIICVGGILPTGFLKQTGISVATKYGTQ